MIYHQICGYAKTKMLRGRVKNVIQATHKSQFLNCRNTMKYEKLVLINYKIQLLINWQLESSGVIGRPRKTDWKTMSLSVFRSLPLTLVAKIPITIFHETVFKIKLTFLNVCRQHVKLPKHSNATGCCTIIITIGIICINFLGYKYHSNCSIASFM